MSEETKKTEDLDQQSEQQNMKNQDIVASDATEGSMALWENLKLLRAYVPIFRDIGEDLKEGVPPLVLDYHHPSMIVMADAFSQLMDWMRSADARIADLEDEFDDTPPVDFENVPDLLPNDQGLVLRLDEFQALFALLTTIYQETGPEKDGLSQQFKEKVHEMTYGFILLLGAKADETSPEAFAKDFDAMIKGAAQ